MNQGATSIIASVSTIIVIKLSFAVIALRRNNKIGLGSGGSADLERAIRAQGDFAEYVPLGVIGFAPALQDHGYQLVNGLPFTEHPR